MITATRQRTAGDGPMKAHPDSFAFLTPPQAADELGRLRPYRVLKLLGHGGMGVVFLTEDPQLQRTVALKAMLPEVAKKPVARERFLREARAVVPVLAARPRCSVPSGLRGHNPGEIPNKSWPSG